MKAHWVTSSRLERVLAARYPFGIPRRARPVHVEVEKKTPSAALLFVAAVSDSRLADDVFAGPQGELLLKAVVQGLSWPRDQIALHFVFADAKEQKKGAALQERLKISERLKASITEARPRAVISLGEEVSAILELPRKPLSAGLETRTLQRDGISFIATANLADVMSSADIKRSFWGDLKNFSSRFKK